MSAIGSILSNDGALKALNSLRTSSNQTNSLEAQLSSGKKINSPADNPAGYITAEGFTSQLNGINQALSNANQGVSLLQTAEGAINQQTSILQKMNSIAVQAANGTQTPAEAQSLQNVIGQLNSQVNTIASQTQFNNINLLDGSFNGVNFQVGANNGQTISLSIAGTKASSIGMYTTGAASKGIYTSSGASAPSSVGSSYGAFSTGTGGAFSATSSLQVQGSNGTGKKITVTTNESAASIAQDVNNQTGSTNVQAQAKTQVALKTSGSSGSTTYSLTLGNGSGSANGITNAVNISAVGKDALVNAINNNTSTTGVSAKVNSSGNVVLNQADGKNIVIKNNIAAPASGSSSPNAIKTVGGGSIGSGGTYGVVQGRVEFQSDQGFSVANAGKIGLGSSTALDKLSNINVSSSTGAQQAINVIKYSLQRLGAEGGQLGAVQQRLQADISNNNTTSQNLSSARSVVQDANIPQVSQELTQQQVLQQAGISALKSSSTLQQQYQRLLP